MRPMGIVGRAVAAGVLPAALAWLIWAAVATPALAGGWAVITLDPLPATLRAGETYPVGFTVLQHGITPMTSTETTIWARSAEGQSLTFSGAEEGAPGHYVAQVRLPQGGVWTWRAGAAFFEPQPLGTITVLAAGQPALETGQSALAAGQPAAAAPRAPSSTAMRVALSIATLCAGALFLTQVAAALPAVRPRGAFPLRLRRRLGIGALERSAERP